MADNFRNAYNRNAKPNGKERSIEERRLLLSLVLFFVHVPCFGRGRGGEQKTRLRSGLETNEFILACSLVSSNVFMA